MIRYLLNAARSEFSFQADSIADNRLASPSLQLEPLEERIMLAFVGFFDGSTLTLTQTVDDGDVTIDNNGGAGVFRTTDGAGTFSFVAADNLVVNLVDNTGNQLDLDLDNAHNGDATLNLGDGARSVNFTGTSNALGGSLSVNGGSGSQNIELAINSNLNVVGAASFNLGTAFDQVDENSFDITVGSDWNMTDVNRFENNGTMNVGGNVNFDTSADDSTGEFDNDTVMNIAGDFNYTGNNLTDTLNTNATLTIAGNYTAHVGEGNTNFNINNPNVNIGGNVSLTSTDSANIDDLNTATGATFGGDWTVDLGGGTNNADFFGTFNGSTVTYVGADGVDTVNYNFSGNPADVTVNLGDSDDTFTLGPNASIDPTTLVIDFGDDSDTFNNNFGPFNFNAQLLGLDGFNHDYTLATDTLISTQISSPGATVTVDNNGFSGEIQFINGGTNTLTTVSNLTITMLDGSATDLNVDLDAALAGGLTINLGNGTRNLSLDGSSNAIGGHLFITGGSGSQSVELSDNNVLSVLGNTSIDLGLDFDDVTDNNNLAFDGNVSLVGVNSFGGVNDLLVTGDFSMSTAADNSGTTFDPINGGSAWFIGNFTYTGNDFSDNVFMEDVFQVDGNVMVDMGGGTNLADFDDFGGTTSIIGGTTTVIGGSGDDTMFANNALSSFGGDISIDFDDGSNLTEFFGSFGGANVTYTGGNGVDDVSYNLAGTLANVTMNLGGGDDSLTLGSNSTIGPALFIDFGDNNDSFTNMLGSFTFDAQLLGLQGFDYHYDFASDTLTANEGSNASLVEFDTNGIGGAFRFNNSVDITTAANLTVNMLDNSGNQLDIDLDAPLAGDLNIALGDGTRTLTFNSGVSNTINGSVSITGGEGNQTVEVAVNTGFSVAGDVSIDLGAGSDLVDEDNNDIAIGGNLEFIGANAFENNGTATVGGNVAVDNSADDVASEFDNDSVMMIAGDFSYTGNDQFDTLNTNADFNVGGNYLASVGDGGSNFNVNGTGVFGGTITVHSTDSVFTDTFNSNTAANTFNGDIAINLGDGTNSANFFGIFNGDHVKYTGGVDGDTVNYDFTGNPADVNAILGAGDDVFTLGANASIAATTLRVDFGGGTDTFTNNFGPFSFDARLVNLNGFNYVYTAATDFLNILQVLDVGDITLDNNGTGGAIRIENGLLSETTFATDVRLNLLPNTGGNLTVDLDSALNGFLHLALKNGARDVTFTGSNNSMAGRLRIEAGSGTQNVALAANADLNVGGNTVINLRSDHDTVDDGVNNLNFGGVVIFRSVNLFENTNTMNVFSDFRMVSIHEVQDTRLDNDGSMNVGGNFNFLGGTALDDVVLNAGVAIAGNAFINVGSAFGVVTSQIVNLTDGFSVGGRLAVHGDTATFGNSVTTDATTTVGGNVILNFTNSAGNNSAMLYGNYGGTYGTFRGGSAMDHVAFGATATDMRFVNLLFDGDDEFTLDTGVILLSGRVDGGNGIDTFNDNVGEPYPFPFEIVNIP